MFAIGEQAFVFNYKVVRKQVDYLGKLHEEKIYDTNNWTSLLLVHRNRVIRDKSFYLSTYYKKFNLSKMIESLCILYISCKKTSVFDTWNPMLFKKPTYNQCSTEGDERNFIS